MYNSFSQDWTWMKANNIINDWGTYGTMGVPTASTNPGSRHGGAFWTDATGKFWLFGGEGLPAVGTSGWLNDLWKYDPLTNEWTWMKGTNVVNQNGLYGTQGVSSPTNNPGGREFAVTWVDASGNLWMFGGDGYAATGPLDKLNDLWKYNPATNEWTWMKGMNVTAQNGIYGTKGISSPANAPGGRYGAGVWSDASGNFWMFGGYGLPASGGNAELNDVWKYNPGTNEWTWMNGTNLGNQNGVYGTKGVSAPTNLPGGRDQMGYWKDFSGNFWVFGGTGLPVSGPTGYLNDTWKYDPVLNQWTWMNGTDTINQNGVYGVKGISAPTTIPGGRSSEISWVDKYGNFWLFGGFGYPSTGAFGRLGDLFKFNPTINEWVWEKGSSFPNQYGVYGTMGVSAPTNRPGARQFTMNWKDLNGDLWLFGGNGFPVAGAPGNMYEIWKYSISCVPENETPTSNHILCSGNSTTVTAITLGGGTITWYPSLTSTVALGTGSNLATPTLTTGASPTNYTYCAEVNTCSLSPVRTTVLVTVNPLPTVTAVTSNTLICTGQSATLTASGALGYNWITFTNTPNIVVSPTTTTNYTVTGIDSAGCTANFIITQNVSLCLGINSFNSNYLFSIHPNPTNGIFILKADVEINEAVVVIYNSLGQEMYRQKINSGENTIDIHHLAKSIYQYRILQSNSVIKSGKIVLE